MQNLHILKVSTKYLVLYLSTGDYTILLHAVLFQYHEGHQYIIHRHGKSCCAGPLSLMCSFADSSHHFDSKDYKLRPPVVQDHENP